jgi:hypothetical protein
MTLCAGFLVKITAILQHPPVSAASQFPPGSIAVAQLMQVCSAAPAVGVQAQETMSCGQPEAYVSGMSGNAASSWEIRPKFVREIRRRRRSRVKTMNVDTYTDYIEDRLTGCIALRGNGAWKLAGSKGMYRVLHNYEGC